MVNILIITDYLAPYEGNFICSVKSLCDKIIQSGGSAKFSFPYYAKQLDWVSNLGEMYSVQYRSTSPYKQLTEIKNMMNSCDIAYTHFCLPKTQCIAKFAVRLSRKSLVQHWHNHYQSASGLKKFLLKWAFEGDMNIGCSKSVAESLPYKQSKVCYVDNAIYFTRLDTYDSTFSFRDRQTQKIVLMFGFDYLRKGVDVAVRAVGQLQPYVDIKLVISLSKGHDKIRYEIEKIFGEFPAWVQIVDARNDVATYYRAADIFLSAAREEGFCYALLEAAYCNCSVISSRIDGVPYGNIPNCYTFECENTEVLVENLREIVNKNEKTLSRENIENKQAVVSRYNLSVWTSDVYDRLCDVSKRL